MASREEDDTKLSSVKYYVLNNENAKDFYEEWRFKTEAIIRKKGWAAALTATSIPTDKDIADAATSDKQKILHKQNGEAYDQILMGCSGVPLGLVKRAKGIAKDALDRLDKKYGSKQQSKLSSLLNDFTNCRLTSTERDPDEWFMELDAINYRLESIKLQYRKED